MENEHRKFSPTFVWFMGFLCGVLLLMGFLLLGGFLP